MNLREMANPGIHYIICKNKHVFDWRHSLLTKSAYTVHIYRVRKACILTISLPNINSDQTTAKQGTWSLCSYLYLRKIMMVKIDAKDQLLKPFPSGYFFSLPLCHLFWKGQFSENWKKPFLQLLKPLWQIKHLLL
jgi:hypothetical protein